LYKTSLCGRKGQSERQLLRHQAAAKSNQSLQASPVGQHLSARWRTCSHSSSCPRLDQEEMTWFHWKQESPAVADKPARRLRKVCTIYVRAVGLEDVARVPIDSVPMVSY